MPETVNGFHLFQLCPGQGPEEGIRFEELENDLGGASSTTVGYGRQIGIRDWKLSFPYLAGTSQQAAVSYKGLTMTPADYLWELFTDSKESGEPFVITSPVNGQYYLAKFADRRMSYARMVTLMFSSGVALKEYARDGVTVFDPLKLAGLWTWMQGDAYSDRGGGVWDWDDLSGNSHTLRGDGSAGGVLPVEDVKNGLGVVRLNDGATGGYLKSSLDVTVYDALFVMSMREAAFTSDCGILTAEATTAILAGDTGETTFYNFGHPATFSYRKNGIEYPQSGQQAPMQEFGVVHVRSTAGIALHKVRIGRDRSATDRDALADFAEILIFEQPNPLSKLRELTHHLITRFNL